MALNLRQIGGGGDQAAHTYPIARAFALTILVALLVTIILRHLFGNVRIEAGTR